MAEETKAFTHETLVLLRQKIDSFTAVYSFDRFETEDSKGFEVISKFFSLSLKQNVLQPKLP